MFFKILMSNLILSSDHRWKVHQNIQISLHIAEHQSSQVVTPRTLSFTSIQRKKHSRPNYEIISNSSKKLDVLTNTKTKSATSHYNLVVVFCQNKVWSLERKLVARLARVVLLLLLLLGRVIKVVVEVVV